MTTRQMPWGNVWLIVELLFEAMSLEEKASPWEILQASYTYTMPRLEVLLGTVFIKLLNMGMRHKA